MRNLQIFMIMIGCVAIAQPIAAQPAKKVTRADIDRLEKKLEDQQKLIDKLVKLQQQYMVAMQAIFEGKDPPVPPPPVIDPPPVTDPKPTTTTKPTAPKAEKPKPKASATGTVVGKVAGASDAIVYVEDIVSNGTGSATMKQQNKQFSPQVLVVQKGTSVSFPNLDAIFHNVFSVTPKSSFDLGSYRQGDTRTVTMAQPGVVTVYCNMHPQMVGHILVVPNANYVRAGSDGFFRLQNVPAGKHRIVAWAPNAQPTVVPADVTENEVVTIEMEVKKGKGGPHKKKDGMPYGSYGDK